MDSNHTLNLYTILFLLLLLMSSFVLSSSSHEGEAHNVPSSQVLYIKKATPFVFNKQEKGKNKKKMMKRRDLKRGNIKNFETRPFSVMLPKGFIPPSGSSPCHNDEPNSVSSFCKLSTTKP
ncbi:hypothetical protein Acr_00g0084040 [Actinidia rufa]|uniref:Transmembrane protein n=1 Tax=Actinidia rufa TaxID=165716 RepID=A0A7J0DWV3_9ERIC|nr:hypothetical protein Acr_00g0084040 [Actinidia rufa]